MIHGCALAEVDVNRDGVADATHAPFVVRACFAGRENGRLLQNKRVVKWRLSGACRALKPFEEHILWPASTP
jgi:hypothetical protein